MFSLTWGDQMQRQKHQFDSLSKSEGVQGKAWERVCRKPFPLCRWRAYLVDCESVDLLPHFVLQRPLTGCAAAPPPGSEGSSATFTESDQLDGLQENGLTFHNVKNTSPCGQGNAKKN